jgi:hypothetical protein
MNQEAYLIWGNHASTDGIGEIVFTVAACMADHYVLRPTRTIKPGKLNIIIDEFSNPHFVSQLAEVKKNNPGTKYIIVATEFITPVSIFGVEFARTFNFFWGAKDWLNLTKNQLLGANRLPSYMHRRYLGFVEAMNVCDLLVFVHPSIGRGLADVREAYPNLHSAPVVIYPELLRALVEQDDRFDLPIGFNLTGTVTRYRRKVMQKLVKQFGRAGWSQPIWKHVSFKESRSLELSNSGLKFHYDREGKDAYLFNISPPQQAGWRYSSPMRILRAALLGQIPVVTKKFNDHDIEDIACLWDGRLDSALKIMHFSMDRRQLIDDYLQSVQRYNAVAKSKNQPFLFALDLLSE